MIDIKLIRENRELVKENIKKKFQDEKLELVDKVYELDKKVRSYKVEGDNLRKEKKDLSAKIGSLIRTDKDAAEKIKEEVSKINIKISELEEAEKTTAEEIKKMMMVIPQIMDETVPVGKDDAENVEIEVFGDIHKKDFEVPYHADICDKFNGLNKDAAGRVSGNGFYYLTGDIARLHEAMLSYGRDFMINKGFTFAIPPFMIRSSVVEGVMSFKEMEDMMYKIEGEDLFLIGTSEHSMIGMFKDQLLKEESLPITMTSYSPCFRKEVGAHGIEERGLYRVHQFEKQEMIVICKEEEAKSWYDKMWSYTVEYFRSLNIPVRTLECCSGDLADLKVKSVDVEAWSPRQEKFFEVGSCSNLGTAQARRLAIRYQGEKENTYAATLNNTVIASPRGLIAFLENNYEADGSIFIPEALRPYMGGMDKIIPEN